jgi:hypothetical protein
LKDQNHFTASHQFWQSTSRVVFIISSSHSGSTLLSMILGAHSDIFAPGETTLFDQWVRGNASCSCTLPVWSCPIWSQVIGRIGCMRGIDVQKFSIEFPIDLNSAFDRSEATQRIAHLLSVAGVRLLPISVWRRVAKLPLFADLARRTQNTLHFYDCVGEVSGRPVLVDSSKSVYRMLHVYSCRPQAVRAIYLTRDGRATINSLMKHYGYSAKLATRRWLVGNFYSKWMLARIPPNQRIHVRYEELCKDPERTVKRVCAVIRVEYEPAMLNFRPAEQHLIAGNVMRLGGRADIAEDGSWRMELPEAALRTFEKMGGRVNRKLLGEYFK